MFSSVSRRFAVQPAIKRVTGVASQRCKLLNAVPVRHYWFDKPIHQQRAMFHLVAVFVLCFVPFTYYARMKATPVKEQQIHMNNRAMDVSEEIEDQLRKEWEGLEGLDLDERKLKARETVDRVLEEHIKKQNPIYYRELKGLIQALQAKEAEKK